MLWALELLLIQLLISDSDFRLCFSQPFIHPL